MSFLTPWFLLGALAIGGPIIFHLIRRVVRERTPFSSLMFLRPTPPRITRRRRLDNIWLLILRCLCLLLLAIGFSRPFFKQEIASPVVTQEGRQLIVLVDASASMRREGVWERALELANARLEETTPADRVMVQVFDQQARTVVGFDQWAAWPIDQRASLAQAELAAQKPTWAGTHLGAALTSSAEQFTDDAVSGKPASIREMVVVTDLQEGAKLDGLQGHDWPVGIQVNVERVNGGKLANAGLQFVNTVTEAAGVESTTRVRVVNASDSTREQFHLGWGTDVASVEIYVPAGQSRIVAAPALPAATQATELRLTGDDLAFDNTAYFVPPVAEQITLLYFGAEAANDPAHPRYYLQRAFPETPLRQIKVVTPPVDGTLPAELLTRAALAVIAENPTTQQMAALKDWLNSGKTVLLLMSNTAVAPTLAALSGLTEVKVTEAVTKYSLFGEIDFTHPLFAPFADPRFSDFTKIHFWKHRTVEFPANAKAQMLARFDNGDPALAQLTIGSGQLLVLASGWHPADSQLAVSTKFLPLMHALLDWSGAGSPARLHYQIGDAISAPVVAGAQSIQWRRPDGVTTNLAAGNSFQQTDVPGVYVATAAGKQSRYAVNLALDESRTAPLSLDELDRLGVPMQSVINVTAQSSEARQRQLQQTELENQQKLWRWLILAVLTVTFLEVALGGWLVRKSQPMEAAT